MLSDHSDNCEENNKIIPGTNHPVPQIENIDILGLIGEGAMARVYKAKQTLLDRIVAVKVLSRELFSSESDVQRFQSEAKLTASLNHPNIVQIIGSGLSANGQSYIVFEFLEGVTLAAEIDSNAPLQLSRIRSIVIPVLDALQYAHERGIIHRDLKPSNIMLCRNKDSEAELVKLLDFGIAKSLSANSGGLLTQTGLMIGSPHYMSPEQCQSKNLDGRTDIYSLCCVMYQALFGAVPFSGDSVLAVMQSHVNEKLPSDSKLASEFKIPAKLVRLVTWGLAKNPDERPQSAKEFSSELSKVFEEITLERLPRLSSSGAKNSFRREAVIPCMISATIAILLISCFCYYSKTSVSNTKSSSSLYNNDNHSWDYEKARQTLLEANDAFKRHERSLAENLARKAIVQMCRVYPEKGSETFIAYNKSIMRQAIELLEQIKPARPEEFPEDHAANGYRQNGKWNDPEYAKYLSLLVKFYGIYGLISDGGDDFCVCVRGFFSYGDAANLSKLISEVETYERNERLLAPKLNMTETSCLLKIAKAYLNIMNGNRPQAVKLSAEAALELDSEAEEMKATKRQLCYSQLAKLEEQLKLNQNALVHAGKAVKITRKYLQAYSERIHITVNELVTLLVKTGNYDQAVKELELLRKDKSPFVPDEEIDKRIQEVRFKQRQQRQFREKHARTTAH